MSTEQLENLRLNCVQFRLQTGSKGTNSVGIGDKRPVLRADGAVLLRAFCV